MCKAHRLLHHSTLGSRVIKKKKEGQCQMKAPLSSEYGTCEDSQGQTMALT